MISDATVTTSTRLPIDRTRCDGHGLLSERIEVDEWGFPIVRDPVVPPEDELAARRRVVACPALALSLTRSSHRTSR